MSHLFKQGPFTLHSGHLADFKIDCDALTDADIETLSNIAHRMLPPFGSVVGIPKGGLRLAKAMEKYITKGPLLLVDDVLTTGASMWEHRVSYRDTIGLVIFSRGKPPYWVFSIFQMPYVV